MSYKRLAKGLMIAACFVCVVIIGYAFVKYLSAPSQSQILSSGTAIDSSTSISKFDATPVTVRNAYFSFTYPSSMHAYAPQPLKAPEIADYSYGYEDIESWQLAVSAQTLVEPALTEDSAYMYRTQHPNQYQLSNITIDGQSIPVMTDTQASGFNKVAFILHGSDVLHVSLYGNDTSGTAMLSSTFIQVLNSIKWSSS